MDRASETDLIDSQSIRELVELWFAALSHRSTEVLVGMCQPDVLVRPYRARQAVGPGEFRGHAGIRDWVASLDDDARITLVLHGIDVTGPESAVVEADVWFDLAGERSGGPTHSVWHFEDGKLSAAIGYGSRDEALAEAANPTT